MGARPLFEKAIYEEIFQVARPLLQTRCNELHTRTCCHFALRLLDVEGGDPDIVVPGIVLHDVGWSKVPEKLQLSAFGPKMTNYELRDTHEREGAALARGILSEVGYPPEKTAFIARIIARHDSRPDAESLEEEIVKDADKLWRCSRRGFALGTKGFPLTPEENLARLEAALEVWFLTQTGRRLAREELAARRAELRLAEPFCDDPGRSPPRTVNFGERL